MTQSWRLWSAILGGWYLIAVASLIVHAPGGSSDVPTPSGGTATVPTHTTFFQLALGYQLSVSVIGLLAFVLIVTAAFAPGALRAAHITLMIVDYSLGIGYLIAALQLGQSWLSAGLILALSSAHLLIFQLHRAAETATRRLADLIADLTEA